MKVEVEMWAFMEGKQIRVVMLPEDDELNLNFLDRVYHYGQNDFQPVRKCPSVSMGDIIRHPDGTRHIVNGCGFIEVDRDWTPEPYMSYHGPVKILPPIYGYKTFEQLEKGFSEFIEEHGVGTPEGE